MATVLNKLVEHLRKAADGNSHTTAPAATVLWSDKEGHWRAAMPVLKPLIPSLVALGGAGGAPRVKEQQKRIGAAEFRNTHYSYTLGAEGFEKFVSTPELQSQGGIGDEPLECG